MFAIKDIIEIQREAASEGEHGLKRVLGPWQLIALGIGCIIGAGIFSMTGEASQHAGPALVISFLLAATACGFAGLCYAELAAVIPVSGSAYTYSYATLGEIVAWIVGWCLVLEYGIASSTVAVSWSGYFVNFLRDFGVHIPPQLMAAYGTQLIEVPNLGNGAGIIAGWQLFNDSLRDQLVAAGVNITTLPQAVSIFNLPAFVSMAIVTGILMLGVKESASLNNIMVIVKCTVILVFIAVGVFYIMPEHWTPFIPLKTLPDGTTHSNYGGIVEGAGKIFFAYIGFDAVSTAAQEAKNPQRDMPMGILGSLVICTVLYIAVALVMTGVVDYRALAVPEPIAVAVDAMKAQAGGSSAWFSVLVFFIKIGALTGLFSVMLVCTYGQIRINYVMSRDGLLPPIFSKLNPKTKTPVANTLICGLVIALVASFMPLSALGTLVSMGTLLAFTIVCIGVIYLRKKSPELERPFRCPWVPFVPVCGILACLYLMIQGLPLKTLEHFFIWMALGFAVYFLYGFTKSQLHEPAKDFKGRKLIGIAALVIVIAYPFYLSMSGGSFSQTEAQKEAGENNVPAEAKQD